MNHVARHAHRLVADALADTPVVVVQGPRQAGKSTLAHQFVGTGPLQKYVTFDDLDVRAAATTDPQGFVSGLGEGAVIDEVQRVPDLVLAIKASVDRDRRAGRFLLTGSANPFHGREETLAGRREDVRLWPFSQAEVGGSDRNAIDSMFAASPDSALRASSEVAPGELVERALRGGYPSAIERRRADRRSAWFRNYVGEVIRTEIVDLAAIEGVLDLPRLVRLLAHRSAGLLNVARLSRDVALPQQTTRRYLALLTEAFLVELVPAWTRTHRKRLVKSPKVTIVDSGLMASLTELNSSRIERAPEQAGPLLETFVLGELRRLSDASKTRPEIHHYRTERGREVDAVLEDGAGAVVGIEVKSGVRVTSEDFEGLRSLADVAGSDFHLGIILHPGSTAVAFGERLWAVPTSFLWD